MKTTSPPQHLEFEEATKKSAVKITHSNPRPTQSPEKKIADKINEEINTTEKHEKFLEEGDEQIAPTTASNSKTLTGKDNTIITTQEAATKETTEEKEQK